MTINSTSSAPVSTALGQVDPLSIRSVLMLETSAHMMTETDWSFRSATIDLAGVSGEPGRFRLFGANHPDSIQKVYDREIDISIMNPNVILSMAYRGIGLYTHPMDVALIAVLPHYDHLGFAVTERSGLTSLSDIRDKRYPLRLSVRGSIDACTTRLMEKILKVHGFGYDDIVSWGGSISYDMPMPDDSTHGGPTRIARAVSGELDAVFDEGVIVWANQAAEAGMKFLDIDEEHLVKLEREGFVRGTLDKARFPKIGRDVATLDFSGWPVYTRNDTADLLVRKFCEAMEARKDRLLWTWGTVKQPPMPIERMLKNSPETPVDIPFHPAALAFWKAQGYLE